MLRRLMLKSLFAGLVFGLPASANAAGAAADFRFYAEGGGIDAGIAEMTRRVADGPDDADATFALGALLFFSAVEGVQQDLYRLGAGNSGPGDGLSGLIPVFRIPAPPNPDPEPASYEKTRLMLAKFEKGLHAAEAVLAKVGERPTKLELDLARVALDANADGTIQDFERIGARMAILPGARVGKSQHSHMLFAFDNADASWLRGYANLLSAFADFMLAFDYEPTYDASFHAVFGNQSTHYGRVLAELGSEKLIGARAELERLLERKKQEDTQLSEQLHPLRTELAEIAVDKTMAFEAKLRRQQEIERQIRRIEFAHKREYGREIGQVCDRIGQLGGHAPADCDGISHSEFFLSRSIFDLVGFVHSISWRVVEPERLAQCRLALLEVARLNRQTWRLAQAETDDDREWLPNPGQKGPFPGLAVTGARIEAWLAAVGLAEQVLNGEKLLPAAHAGGAGINLRRFFETADSFDLVAFIVGPGSVDYREFGEIADPAAFRAITRPLAGKFGEFAIWFN